MNDEREDYERLTMVCDDLEECQAKLAAAEAHMRELEADRVAELSARVKFAERAEIAESEARALREKIERARSEMEAVWHGNDCNRGEPCAACTGLAVLRD